MRLNLILQQLYCIISLAIITGCYSKNVLVVDMNNKPIHGALVAAYQQNIIGPNRKELFKSDANGLVLIPFSGLVSLYTGKEGYDINKAIVSKIDYKVVMVKYSNEPTSVKHVSYLLSGHYAILDSSLWSEWVAYINWLEAQRQANAK